MTVKEYIEKKQKEYDQAKAKDMVRKSHDNESKEDRALVSKFYSAMASGNTALKESLNTEIAKQYEAKGQQVDTIGTGTAGGVLVPTTVADRIVSQLKYISPIRQIATVISDMPAQLELPSETSMVQAYWVGETVAATPSAEAFAPNLLTPYQLVGLDSLTGAILQDAATNPSIQQYVENRFATALALKENDAFVNGDGSGKPYGFRSSAITPGSVAQAGAALAYKDVVALKYALPVAYRNLGVYLVSSAGMQALENVKDSQGRPIWREGLSDSEPATVLGRPVHVVEEIPSNLGAGTNQTEIWYGYFTNYFIGDRQGIRVDYGLQGTDFASNQISLRVLERVAGRPVQGESFAKLTGVISA